MTGVSSARGLYEKVGMKHMVEKLYGCVDGVHRANSL